MIVVRLKGGLGNQMFQYAFGKYLATKYNTKLKLDLSFLHDRTPKENFIFRSYDLDIFTLKANFVNKMDLALFSLSDYKLLNILHKVLFRIGRKYTVIRESHFQFDKTELSFPNNVYLDGYWQSEKYFIDVEDQIRLDFTFKNELIGKSNDLAEKIESTNSICLNVRREDYVHLESSGHGFIDQNYFYKAIDLLSKETIDFEIFVFSDDIDWCIKNLSFNTKTTYVTHEYKGLKFAEYLQLMTQCKHFVIPNSTFGWWGAWLNPNPDKIVIAPKQWFADEKMNNQTQDLIPETWIRL